MQLDDRYRLQNFLDLVTIGSKVYMHWKGTDHLGAPLDFASPERRVSNDVYHLIRMTQIKDVEDTLYFRLVFLVFDLVILKLPCAVREISSSLEISDVESIK